jgi:GrpB-like predicted nucleotidyltransferase (UPF0157 family)
VGELDPAIRIAEPDPEWAAKPILDLQLSVAALEPLAAYAGPLASLGYVFVPDPEMPDYRFFGKPTEELERAPAGRHPQDRLAYIAGKEPYMSALEARAVRWALGR